ncbi:MAG: hypothetical protein PHQ52_05660 [Candidatus Omnitrophica bacterium]|nr:hypothetical protein [Candidatus Omnitrophota bacterium]
MRILKHTFGKREIIYLCIILILLAVIRMKKTQITIERNKKIISMINEFRDKGIPVEIDIASVQDVFLYEKTTILKSVDNNFYGYLTRVQKKEIKPGAKVYTKINGKKIYGVIFEIADNLDMSEGMFKSKVKFQEPINDEKIVIYMQVKEYKNVFAYDNSILQREEHRTYLWKIKDNKAYKIEVYVCARDVTKSIIDKGIVSGDEVVIKGASMLSEGDFVRIVKTSENKG